MMDVEKLEETGSDFKVEMKSDFAESYGVTPVRVPQSRWEVRGGGGGGGGGGGEDMQEKLLYSCHAAEGSIDQAIRSSFLEYWVCLDNQHNIADCPVDRTPSLPATPVTHMPSPVTPVLGSGLNPMIPCLSADTFSPMCLPTDSSWDSGGSDQDPISAAAHLHLLGESLSLIGQLLQETNKTVSMPTSLSLLLDSLLCALSPLMSLTTQLPELRSCMRHTLASTVENMTYLMPGL